MGARLWVRGICACLTCGLVLVGFSVAASAQDDDGMVVDVVLSDPVTIVSGPLPENPPLVPVVTTAPLVVESYPVPPPAPVIVAAPDPHAGLATDPAVQCIAMAPFPCNPLP